MPELPEVEHMRRTLAKVAGEREVCAFELLDPTLLRGAAPGVPVHGRTRRVLRRGKYLAWEVGDSAWILHFRMTGRLVTDAASARARWTFADGGAVGFVDPRRLGEIWRVSASELDARLAALPLGPEPWPESRDGGWWAERFAGARGPVKPALMEQARVAGLGNIAGSEICFRARISPERPVQALETETWARLAEAVPAYVNATLASLELGDARYVNEGGSNPFLVYGREGQPCPQCRAAIRRIPQRGRSTFACATCTPLS